MYGKTIPIAAAFALWMGAAQADPFNDAIIENLTGLGYEFIEIKNGPTQVKVEAIRGSEKLEIIFDRATGNILKQEMETPDSDEIGLSGVEIDTRNEDFLDHHDIGDDHDDDDDDDDDDNDDDDGDNSGHGGGDDDDDNSGHGGGDDDDDDDNSGHGGGDDDDDHDNSGPGNSDDD